MTYFVSDREPEKRRAIRARQASEPLDPIDVDRRQFAFPDACVYQGVSEPELPMRGRCRGQANEPDGQLRRR